MQVESGHVLDVIGASTIIATIVGYLPAIAAAIALSWYLIQIWESRTVQNYLSNTKIACKARRIARLRAQEKIILAKLDALETVRQAKIMAKDKLEQAKVEAAKLKAYEQTMAAIKDNSSIDD